MRLREAVRAAFKDLRGRNTIIILAKDGEVIAARNGSPLVLGTKENRKNNSELYFSSDVLSFGAHVSSVLVMENGQMVSKMLTACRLWISRKARRSHRNSKKNAIVGADVDKGAYDHYMLKEIHDNPLVIRQVLKEPDANYKKLATAIKKAKTVYMIGSGTAGAAAAQIAFYLRVYGKIRAVSLIGAEASDYYPLIRKGDLLISPSQSGETADVLEVLELAKNVGRRSQAT